MNNYDHLIFRGKTNRRRKQDSKKQREKELLKLDRRQTELWKARNSLGLEELEEPYQKGYKRYFVLREDIARSKYGTYYEELLPYINTIQYSSKADFKKRKRRRKNGKKQYKLREQYLFEVPHHLFNKIPEKYKEHFVERRKKYHNFYFKYFVFTAAWRYHLVIEPNIITHRKIIDHELESKISKLGNYIDRKYLDHKISKAKSHRYKYRYWNDDELNIRDKQMSIHKIEQMLYEEKIDNKVIKMDSRGCPFSFDINILLDQILFRFNAI